MGPLGIRPSKSQPRSEGRKEGEHSTAKPPLPHYRKKPNNPKPQRQEEAKCLYGEAFHKWGLSIALNWSILAESPMKPWC